MTDERPSIRILIAEDEKATGDLLVNSLSQPGRRLQIVYNGLDAIAALQSQPYDLLITDLMMPGADGLEVMKKAKELYPEIMIIIMTGYASLDTAIEAIHGGAYDYIRKPFRLDELEICVQNACERILMLKENQALLKRIEELDRLKQTEPPVQPSQPIFLYPSDIPPSAYYAQTQSGNDALTHLERLSSLYEKGLISLDEFNIMKQKLFAKI
jgi:DNA-binding NtrC family response regulator